MKVKVLKKFKDKHTGKIHKRDEILEVNEERLQEILKVEKLVEVVEEAAEEPVEEAAEEKAPRKGKKNAK